MNIRSRKVRAMFGNGRPLPWDRKYRVMKDPEGHAGGAPQGQSQAPGGDNTGGNGNTSTQSTPSGDNRGQDFDYNQFWSSPGDGNGGAAPSRESTPTPTPAPGQQQSQENPTVTALKNMSFGESANIMTPQMMTDLSEGKTEGFHTAMQGFGRNVAEQTIRTMIPLMQSLRDTVLEQVKSQMGEQFQSRESAADLLAAIPSAKDPRVRPQVDAIFSKAMTHTKGDRKAAIDMTKDMLRLTANTLGGDIGLPPPSAGDHTALVPSKVDWLSELAGR